jgi:glycosyltransferase involved in cell wall biosynthesis
VDLFFYPAVYSYFPQPPGRRSVICFHDVIAETYPRLVFPNRRSEWAWDLKSRLAMWQSTRVMTVSEASRQGLVEHFKVSPDRVDVVTEGTDPRFRVLERATVEECLRRLRIPRDAPYLLYVGGISPHKNLATLLRAMPAVLQGAAVNLVLAGDLQAGGFLANSRELQQVIEADAGLRHRCRFTGFLSDEDLVALYNGAYALVFPSLLEGFGLPALESMASGTPVIASRAGALPEVVGDSGLLFDPRDAGEMAAQILRLVEDPGLRATLAGRARERAKQFTWRRAAELALECFERAVA